MSAQNRQSSNAYRDHMERVVEFDKERIAKKARSLIITLEKLEKQCLAPGLPIISEIGELQGSATQFEAACGRYAADKDALLAFDAFMRAPVEA